MKYGQIKQIADDAGLNDKTVWNYCHGRRVAGYQKAKALEAATGVDKLIWLEGDRNKIQAALESSPRVNG